MGLWMGIGYNVRSMASGDATMCRILWTNSPTDTFVCEDRFFAGERVPTLDQNRNVVDIKTNVLNTTDPITRDYSLFAEATFERPFVSPDPITTEDTNIPPDSNINMIWAFGEISSGSPTYHGTTNRGITNLYVSSQGIQMIGLSTAATFMAILLTLYSVLVF